MYALYVGRENVQYGGHDLEVFKLLVLIDPTTSTFRCKKHIARQMKDDTKPSTYFIALYTS